MTAQTEVSLFFSDRRIEGRVIHTELPGSAFTWMYRVVSPAPQKKLMPGTQLHKSVGSDDLTFQTKVMFSFQPFIFQDVSPNTSRSGQLKMVHLWFFRLISIGSMEKKGRCSSAMVNIYIPNLQCGPLTVISRVITSFTGVITPVPHLQGQLQGL